MAAMTSAALKRGFYTVPEVAYSAEVEDKSVNREIDAKIVDVAGQSPSGERLIDRTGVLYMAAIRDLRTDLSREARLQLAQRLRAGKRKLMLGLFEVHVSRLNALVRPRLEAVDSLRGAVTSDPSVCGGDAVLRGTRVRVHMIAELVAQKTSLAELEAEFDVSPGKVGIALLYARLHPRRGRRELVRNDLVEHVPARR